MSEFNSAKVAIQKYKSDNSKSKSDLDRVINSYIGKWIIITGSPRISSEVFNRSFPNGIFGKIIGYNMMKGFEVRTYANKNTNYDGKIERHPMMYGSLNHIKIF